MSKPSIRDLKPGDKVTLKFRGSKTFGNEAYEEQSVFKRFHTEAGRELAEFDDFSIYKADRYWRYGASAEIVTLLDIHQ